jgi:AraC family transcriptional regulator, regulatory protein of adaptative response / DNA-3-methyladenine glycosylase II
VLEDFEGCYRAVSSRDPRFDGWFFTAVTSTGIYCRPSCPARTPSPRHVRFYPSAAAAQQAGFRACTRCRPDAAPGSPEWNVRADVVARAMRLIADGTVDREGVPSLAARLGYSERQIHRLLVAEVGTGALALARAQRAQTARLLLETTDLPVTGVAFTAGFASVRQFNDTFREVFAMTPTELRRRLPGRSRRRGSTDRRRPSDATTDTVAPVPTGATTVVLRLAHRQPFDAAGVLAFLGARSVPGVEAYVDGSFRRSLRLDHGSGVVSLSPGDGHVAAVLALADLRDLTAAVSRCRRLLDLDADPVAIDAALAKDQLLAPLVASSPGRRVPGTVDGAELAVRAVIGQQVSVAGARSVAGRLVVHAGPVLAGAAPTAEGSLGSDRRGVTHCFPSPSEIISAGDDAFAMPAARRGALRALAEVLDAGELVLDCGADLAEARDGLLAVPGIGRWTAGYVAMRALRDPDAFLPDDLGVRQGLRHLSVAGGEDDAGSRRALLTRAEEWRPWRAYAAMHLWAAAGPPGVDGRPPLGPKRTGRDRTKKTRTHPSAKERVA